MDVQKPAVSCNSCGRQWNSPTMAEGLRVLGSCPRCHGDLSFADDVSAVAEQAPEMSGDVAPHLVLGLPRLPY